MGNPVAKFAFESQIDSEITVELKREDELECTMPDSVIIKAKSGTGVYEMYVSNNRSVNFASGEWRVTYGNVNYFFKISVNSLDAGLEAFGGPVEKIISGDLNLIYLKTP